MWPWSSLKKKGSEAWADVMGNGQSESNLAGDVEAKKASRKSDASAYLSVSHTKSLETQHFHKEDSQKEADEEEGEDEEPLGLQPSFPLPLIIFVSGLSILAGLVVTGVHYAIIYSGCPLGVNGCNAFMGKEEKGFFLVKAVIGISDSIPEDVIYILMSVIGATAFVCIHANLSEDLQFQIRGGGTIQSLIAVATGERISLKAAGLRIITSCCYLGCGGTMGFDGPAIQVCTAATTCFGWAVGMRSMPTQSLLACLGFAAGFAASFNSPLAGILFSMEELQHVSSRLSKHIICLILMASIIATAVARACSGNYQLLEANWDEDSLFDSVQGGSLNQVFGTQMWMLVAVPIGMICSLWGFVMHWCIRWMHRRRKRLKKCYSAAFVIQSLLTACIGSLVFRTTGLRGIWGIGCESLQEAFDRHFPMSEYLVFAGGKSMAMILGVALRAPGDMLEPVLISGAFLGGSIGSFLQGVIKDDALASQVMKPCLLFGVVGLFASCFRFPLTPVVIVLELMGVETYALVLPAALAGFTALTVSNRLFPPLLDEVMHEDNIDLHKLSDEADAAHAALEEMLYDEGSDDESEQETEPESESQVEGSECSSHYSIPQSCASRGSRPSRDNTRSNTKSSVSVPSSSAMQLLLNNIEASMQTLSTNSSPNSVRRSFSSSISSEGIPEGSSEGRRSSMAAGRRCSQLAPLEHKVRRESVMDKGGRRESVMKGRRESKAGIGTRSNSRANTDTSLPSAGSLASAGNLTLNLLPMPGTHSPSSPRESVSNSMGGCQTGYSSGRHSSKSSNSGRNGSPFGSFAHGTFSDEVKRPASPTGGSPETGSLADDLKRQASPPGSSSLHGPLADEHRKPTLLSPENCLTGAVERSSNSCGSPKSQASLTLAAGTAASRSSDNRYSPECSFAASESTSQPAAEKPDAEDADRQDSAKQFSASAPGTSKAADALALGAAEVGSLAKEPAATSSDKGQIPDELTSGDSQMPDELTSGASQMPDDLASGDSQMPDELASGASQSHKDSEEQPAASCADRCSLVSLTSGDFPEQVLPAPEASKESTLTEQALMAPEDSTQSTLAPVTVSPPLEASTLGSLSTANAPDAGAVAPDESSPNHIT